MPHKYLLLFGALLFMALGEAIETVAAATHSTTSAATSVIGPYAKRKPVKAQYKRKKGKIRQGRPLNHTIY